jgi:hypothetical protein
MALGFSQISSSPLSSICCWKYHASVLCYMVSPFVQCLSHSSHKLLISDT